MERSKVTGGGAECLRQNGVLVECGPWESRARGLIQRWRATLQASLAAPGVRCPVAPTASEPEHEYCESANYTTEFEPVRVRAW